MHKYKLTLIDNRTMKARDITVRAYTAEDAWFITAKECWNTTYGSDMNGNSMPTEGVMNIECMED